MTTPAPIILWPTAAASRIGGHTVQQDRACVVPDRHRIAVFDGHGEFGGLAATVAASSMAAASTETPLRTLFANAETTIHEALRADLETRQQPFVEIHGAFHRPGGLRGPGAQILGGTTASIVELDPATGAVQIAHVGDSDVAVFDGPTDPGQFLLTDHTPLSLPEWLRVHSACSATQFVFTPPRRAPVFRPVWMSSSVEPSGWMRNPVGGFAYRDIRNSWSAYLVAPDRSEQLAMTRSLGDFYLKRFGVSAEPSLRSHPAPPPDTMRAIVLGTDGFWDTAHLHEVRDIVYRADLVGRPDAATDALISWGDAQATKHFGAQRDNSTVAVVYVRTPPARPSCAIHPAEPPALGYSVNSRGETSLFAPACTCSSSAESSAE